VLATVAMLEGKLQLPARRHVLMTSSERSSEEAHAKLACERLSVARRRAC
jgi:hypothetical protein